MKTWHLFAVFGLVVVGVYVLNRNDIAFHQWLTPPPAVTGSTGGGIAAGQGGVPAV